LRFSRSCRPVRALVERSSTGLARVANRPIFSYSALATLATGSLLGLLANFFPNGLEQVLVATILREVLRALVYLHSHGLIHGYSAK